METTKKQSRTMNAGALLILIGALSIFPENDTWMHSVLQITFFAGCVVYLVGRKLVN